jgi:hypothetical protein
LQRQRHGANHYFPSGPDLYVAAQEAVRAMVGHLSGSYGLTGEDAYLLCSLAVDLKISEIVDAGQFVVSALLPEADLQLLMTFATRPELRRRRRLKDHAGYPPPSARSRSLHKSSGCSQPTLRRSSDGGATSAG